MKNDGPRVVFHAPSTSKYCFLRKQSAPLAYKLPVSIAQLSSRRTHSLFVILLHAGSRDTPDPAASVGAHPLMSSCQRDRITPQLRLRLPECWFGFRQSPAFRTSSPPESAIRILRSTKGKQNTSRHCKAH